MRQRIAVVESNRMSRAVENIFWIMLCVAKEQIFRLTPGNRRMGRSKAWVEVKRSFEQVPRLTVTIPCASRNQPHAAMEEFPRTKVFRRCRLRPFVLGAAYFWLDLSCNPLSDLVLNGEDVVELAVEPFRPNVVTSDAIEKLS